MISPNGPKLLLRSSSCAAETDWLLRMRHVDPTADLFAARRRRSDDNNRGTDYRYLRVQAAYEQGCVGDLVARPCRTRRATAGELPMIRAGMLVGWYYRQAPRPTDSQREAWRRMGLLR
eukprot:scaffold624_cov402-Prasinococcus_capsulatus_cf.AAC.41